MSTYNMGLNEEMAKIMIKYHQIRTLSVHLGPCANYPNTSEFLVIIYSITTEVAGTHEDRLSNVLLMSTHNLFYEEMTINT